VVDLVRNEPFDGAMGETFNIEFPRGEDYLAVGNGAPGDKPSFFFPTQKARCREIAALYPTGSLFLPLGAFLIVVAEKILPREIQSSGQRAGPGGGPVWTGSRGKACKQNGRIIKTGYRGPRGPK